jgi:hypothetical protein
MNLYECTVNNEKTNKEWLRTPKPFKIEVKEGRNAHEGVTWAC